MIMYILQIMFNHYIILYIVYTIMILYKSRVLGEVLVNVKNACALFDPRPALSGHEGMTQKVWTLTSISSFCSQLSSSEPLFLGRYVIFRRRWPFTRDLWLHRKKRQAHIMVKAGGWRSITPLNSAHLCPLLFF